MSFLSRAVTGILFPFAAVFAADTTIDFADSTGTSSSFSSRGYTFTNGNATVLGITPVYQIWALTGNTYAFDFAEDNGAPFALKSLNLEFVGNQPIFAVGGVLFRGNLQGGGKVYQATSLVTYVDAIPGISILANQTVVFDSSWTNLLSVDVYMTSSVNSLTGYLFDNILVGPGGPLPAVIDVDTAPPNLAVHPDHDGSPGAIGGLNDVIEVVVMGASVGAGDAVDLDTGNIDPASVRFGPSAAVIDPGSTTQFNIDYDSDGILDARFHFLTGDTGIGCADTEVTLTGQLVGGTEFAGTDAVFDSACEATCH